MRSKEQEEHEKTVFELYKVFRAYVIHEDVLISQRMQRMLLVQGALFTAAGTAVVRCSDATIPFNAIFWGTSLLLIALIGFLGALFAKEALEAARNAIDRLKVLWIDAEQKWTKEGKPTGSDLLLPGITGAGSDEVHRDGLRHILSLPTLFMWAIWPAFVVLSVGLIYKALVETRHL